jgi:hypothetical protein
MQQRLGVPDTVRYPFLYAGTWKTIISDLGESANFQITYHLKTTPFSIPVPSQTLCQACAIPHMTAGVPYINTRPILSTL